MSEARKESKTASDSSYIPSWVFLVYFEQVY